MCIGVNIYVRIKRQELKPYGQRTTENTRGTAEGVW